MSNFTSVPQKFAGIMANAIEAEKFVYDNTDIPGLFLRKCIEAWVHFIYENEPSLALPYDTTINSLMKNPGFKDIIGDTGVLYQMNGIRIAGNKAIHNSGKRKISIEECVHTLKLLHGVSFYFINLYNEERVSCQPFDEKKYRRHKLSRKIS